MAQFEDEFKHEFPGKSGLLFKAEAGILVGLGKKKNSLL